jgi:hypothetical protein
MNPELRDKDITVLQAIQNGATDTHQIKQETQLTTREINYSINEYSLQEKGLVQVEKQDGREWRQINGHQKKVWKPKKLQLTDKAIQLLNQLETETGYENVSKRELAQRIQELEQRQNRLENQFKDFRNKVMDELQT